MTSLRFQGVVPFHQKDADMLSAIREQVTNAPHNRCKMVDQSWPADGRNSNPRVAYLVGPDKDICDIMQGAAAVSPHKKPILERMVAFLDSQVKFSVPDPDGDRY